MKNVVLSTLLAFACTAFPISSFAQERPSVSGNASAIVNLQNQVIELETQLLALQAELSSHGGTERTWQNVTPSRSFSTEYTNNTGSDLEVGILVNQGGCCEGQDIVYLEVKDPSQSSYSRIGFAKVSRRFNEQTDSLFGTVPAGYQYRLIRGNNRALLISWNELSE